ncbi:MAG: TrkA family potassium uptake protein [Erysipelotrichaceae bacterium]|nr:TrkA family potassium uptake protein [Erysipelotrichaceae bacterium]
MKVVIADGFHEADYIINLFNSKVNDLVVINESEDIAHYLSLNNDIPVMIGHCTKESDLIEAGAQDCDLFMALSEDDYKSYVACKTAKKIGAKRVIATVINPKNVKIFKDLGIDMVVCSTYLLGEQIRNLTSIENMVNSLSLEDDKVAILEIKVSDSLAVNGKTLAEINISDLGVISSIMRNGKAIIPNGQSQIMSGDTILIVTTTEDRNKIIDVFKRKK